MTTTTHESSLYSVTIPPVQAMLGNLRAILEKAEAYAKERGGKEEQLLHDRIVFDQFTLARQVQAAASGAQSLAAKLAGMEAPKSENAETTLAELRGRIDAVLAYIAEVPQGQIDGKDEALIPMPYTEGKALAAHDFATLYALPNFYFHVVAAYEILRKNGLSIGKSDYLGHLPVVDLAA